MFNEVFNQIPTSFSVARHWAAQSITVLDAAAHVIAAHDANPWVFVADERHFQQFAGEAEHAALAALTAKQAQALCAWI